MDSVISSTCPKNLSYLLPVVSSRINLASSHPFEREWVSEVPHMPRDEIVIEFSLVSIIREREGPHHRIPERGKSPHVPTRGHWEPCCFHMSILIEPCYQQTIFIYIFPMVPWNGSRRDWVPQVDAIRGEGVQVVTLRDIDWVKRVENWIFFWCCCLNCYG